MKGDHMKKFLTITMSIFLAAFFAGCDSVPNQKSGKKPSQYLSVKGSDTMVHLVSIWAEDFMAGHPDTDISVTGGGSGTGIASLINGTTDICASSRSLQAKEIDLLRKAGITPLEIPVARDGLALVVNPENPVNQLTMEQIRNIFTGRITNWQGVGGPDKPIQVMSRESSSGTFVFFQEHVMEKEDYTRTARLLPGTSALIQAVAADRWTIAYVGLGFAEESHGTVKTLAVQAPGQDEAVLPTEESIRIGKYSVSRPLFFYSNGEPKGAVKEFVDFCLSPAGQEIVKKAGYVPVS
jgi:phosphate transport system substrate-binding protein